MARNRRGAHRLVKGTKRAPWRREAARTDDLGLRAVPLVTPVMAEVAVPALAVQDILPGRRLQQRTLQPTPATPPVPESRPVLDVAVPAPVLPKSPVRSGQAALSAFAELSQMSASRADPATDKTVGK